MNKKPTYQELENQVAELKKQNEILRLNSTFQNGEKEKRAAELYLANIELDFQNEEKLKRAAKLIIANIELAFQNEEKKKRAAELIIANIKKALQNEEKEKLAAELIIANLSLVSQIELIKTKEKAEESELNLKMLNEEYRTTIEELRQTNEELFFAKEKVEESEETFKMLFNNLSDAVYISEIVEGKVSNFIQVNNTACKRMGYTREELLAKSGFDISTEKSNVNNRSIIPILIEKKRLTLENEHVTKNGIIIPVEINTQITQFKNRTIILSIARDITERKLVEKELIKAKEKAEKNAIELNKVQEITHVGSWYLDTETNEVAWTEELYKMYGFDPTLPPPPYTEHMKLFTPESWEILSTSLAKTRETGIPYELELKTIRKGKTSGWMWVRGEAIFDKNNKIIALWGAAQDITERKQIEEDLINAKEKAETSEKRFKKIIESAPDGVVINSQDGRLIYASPNSYRHFGYSENEIIGHFGDEFTHPEDLQIVIKAFETIFINPLLKPKVEYRFRRKDGEYRWIETTFTNLLEDKSINGIVLNFSDITDRKRLFEELLISKEKVEESDRLKTAFLQNISHEIRTPLTAICGFSGMLNKPNITDEKRDSFVSIIRNSSSQLLSIVTDILTISSLETKQEKTNIQKVEINTIIIELLSVFKLQANNQNISIYSKKELTDEQSIIYTDKTKIVQILSNLISNALKFTHKGSIEFGYNLIDTELRFFVKDNGIGIKHELHGKIFERFRQADLSTSKNYGGTGLGLSISKGFVELLGGKIWVISEEEKGSTFYFTIPYNPVNEINKTITLAKNTETNRTVLIAEDEEYNFLFIEELLSDLNLNLIHATNGQIAVDICKSNLKIDLILMDIKMPEMDGHEAAKRIKEFRPELPIIAQSAYALEHERAKYEGVFDNYITKPLNEKDLKQKVLKYIDIKKE